DNSLEPLRMAGDLVRLGQVGVYVAFGGEPYVPDLHSSTAQGFPTDPNAQLEYLKQKELENLKDGAVAAATMGALKGGGKLFRRFRPPTSSSTVVASGPNALQSAMLRWGIEDERQALKALEVYQRASQSTGL